jgi:hypothetical protein
MSQTGGCDRYAPALSIFDAVLRAVAGARVVMVLRGVVVVVVMMVVVVVVRFMWRMRESPRPGAHGGGVDSREGRFRVARTDGAQTRGREGRGGGDGVGGGVWVA